MSIDRYSNPLTERYASPEMSRIFSPRFKFGTWRRLWLALAEAEQELGLPISDQAIAAIAAHLEDFDLRRAAELERQLRHDVMAHVHHLGEQAPEARAIIHLGATSAYVGDNTDLIQHREALALVARRIVAVVAALARFAREHRALPALAFTHFQPAQPTTVGKRATLWIQDLLLDLEEIEFRVSTLRFLGVRGTTGTQASFVDLFEGDGEKVDRLNRRVAEKMGFAQVYGVSGQTYTRKTDYALLSTLAGVAQSASKFANDVRLLSHLKEVEEPFEEQQIGSSAMPYKRNPMRSERIGALARHAIALVIDPAFTAASQWFERTLDDSANKRIAVPESYLSVDAVLLLMHNVASGMVVYPEMIRRRLMEELPFMATENLMMRAAKKGGDRQDLHERVRVHSVDAGRQVKEHGLPNDLLDRLAADPAFTAASQWFERTLDDSANKRIAIPEAYLTVDAVLLLMHNVASGMVVYPEMIRRRLMEELPFMATENLMMRAAKRGGDRQDLHERVRVHSIEAGRQVKQHGLPNDLMDRIAADEAFGVTRAELEEDLRPELYVGRATAQVDEFLEEWVAPVLARYPDAVGGAAPELTV
ncbi:MAG TPA: adenylosuccinate lyase [Longimicrobium sp.]|nr:adenylosuccinate lyase [Longimicrobium sp.]